MSNHTHSDMRVSIGFAVGFFVAFLVTIFAPKGITESQIETVWIFAISAGFINHGIWYRERGLILGGFLSIAISLISLPFLPPFFPAGWIILGAAIAVSGFYRAPRTGNLLIGVYITIGGIIRLLSAFFQTSFFSAWMVWMVLIGLIILTVAMEGKNSVMQFMGISCILVSVVTYTFFPEFMFLSVTLVFVVGLPLNLIYLHRLFGRTPKIGEIFSFATRALFLRGVKKPIDHYSVIAIIIKGNIGAEKIVQELTYHLNPRCTPILLLGPTAPTQLSLPKEAKIGWVTTVSGAAEFDYPILPPEDPSMVSVFLNKTLETVSEDRRPVILGDFIDSMIPHMNDSLFYKYYSDLASAARILNHTVILIVKADIHNEIDINVVKRFADVIIENREREEKGRLIREVRVSNRVDNIHTDWEKY